MAAEEDYRYDTQLLIDGHQLDCATIEDGINSSISGDCLLVIGGGELVKIHFHTNVPWDVLKYCSRFGEIYDIVIEDMVRQANGQKG